jgi:hypothetical protein
MYIFFCRMLRLRSLWYRLINILELVTGWDCEVVAQLEGVDFRVVPLPVVIEFMRFYVRSPYELFDSFSHCRNFDSYLPASSELCCGDLFDSHWRGGVIG